MEKGKKKSKIYFVLYYFNSEEVKIKWGRLLCLHYYQASSLRLIESSVCVCQRVEKDKERCVCVHCVYLFAYV